MARNHGKSQWADLDLLRAHLENAPSLRQLIEERRAPTAWPMTPRKVATVHTIIHDELTDFSDLELRVLGMDLSSGPDQSVAVTGRLSGNNPQFIIIDDVEPMLSEELYDFMRELGVKEKKPAKPFKQPDWARHNQAPRSARRR